MNKKEFINEIKPYFMFPQDEGNGIEEMLMRGLIAFEQSIREDCAKEMIKNIKIGWTDKFVQDENCKWQTYFKIGNQTFYCTQCEDEKTAKWFSEQMTHAFLTITKAIRDK